VLRNEDANNVVPGCQQLYLFWKIVISAAVVSEQQET